MNDILNDTWEIIDVDLLLSFCLPRDTSRKRVIMKKSIIPKSEKALIAEKEIFKSKGDSYLLLNVKFLLKNNRKLNAV